MTESQSCAEATQLDELDSPVTDKIVSDGRRGVVSEIVASVLPEVFARGFQSMTAIERRALVDTAACRTPWLGGMRLKCNRCGHELPRYHSCGNRNCPQCHRGQAMRWVEKASADFLPVPYFHVVFSLPRELRTLAAFNRKAVYSMMMASAADAITSAAREYCGDGSLLLGVIVCMHTSGCGLAFHPHVHCMLPAVALKGDRKTGRMLEDGRGKPFLADVYRLSRFFQLRFLARLSGWIENGSVVSPQADLEPNVWAKLQLLSLPDSFGNAFVDVASSGPKDLAGYIARYICRAPISDSAIISWSTAEVVLASKYGSGPDNGRTVAMPTHEFVRRLRMHVMPPGFNSIRRYGFLWGQCRPQNVAVLRAWLEQAAGVRLTRADANVDANGNGASNDRGESDKCPVCEEGVMCPAFVISPEPPPPAWWERHGRFSLAEYVAAAAARGLLRRTLVAKRSPGLDAPL